MDPSRLVEDDAQRGLFRIHRSALTSAEILEIERERIFDRCWLYVAHESEVPNVGDFRRRVVADRPLFIIRSRDGKVRVFLNSCRHRGALVCRTDEGNARGFACFYHGWSYNDAGELVAVPDASGYAEGFRLSDHGLMSPPRVDSYRGMYFVSFAADGPSLADYLGPGAREMIDLTMDCAEILGGWAVLGGTAKYNIRANWKLLVENSSDNYHYGPTHQSYVEYLAKRRQQPNNTLPQTSGRPSRSVALENGHVAMLTSAGGRPIASPSPLWNDAAAAEALRLRGELAKRYGEARGHEMADVSRFLIIFPNFAFHDTQSGFKFRQWWPTAPDMMEVAQWELVPRQERDDLRQYRLEGSSIFQGPGGFGTPDDIEALESCQQGYRARELEWSDASRGMRRANPGDTDELTARGFWRQWYALINGRPGATRIGDIPFTRPVNAAE